MGLFDFLAQDPTGGQGFGLSGNPAEAMPTAQAPSTQLAPDQAPNANASGLLQAPAQQAQGPGLLERLRTPDDTGISFMDKIGAAGAMLRDDATPDAGYKLLTAKQQAYQKAKASQAADALKEKGNRAFKAAYANGKFDPNAYAEVMGDDFDPLTMGKVAKVVAPVGGVEGGYSYAKDPLTGAVTWGGERPPTYADTISNASLQERARHDQVTEGQGAGHLSVAQQNAALAAKREGRLASKPTAGGASWLPAGAKILHVPGS